MLPSRRLLLLAPLVIAIAAGAGPSVASATERYASATGDGAGCTAAHPCDFENAVKIAGAGDEVIVSPGNYSLTKTVEDNAQITIRGVAGQPRPRLLFSGPNQTGLRLMNGSLLRDVEIEQAEEVAAVQTSGARLDRVVVRGGGGIGDCAVNLRDGLIRDSLVVADSSPICSVAWGVPNTGVYRNVTAIATDHGAAIVVIATSGTATIDLTNVIARGAQGTPGIGIATDVFGGPVTLTATHSNFDGWGGCCATVNFVDGGGNQTAAPKFVDPAHGDYRQAVGSVTIDAGVNAPLNGAFDIDGEPRRIDTTDIGADERVRPPTVSTGPATGIGPRSATLIGSVKLIGVPTSYRFEYGTTTAYGNETAATDLGDDVTELPVATTVDGLSPGTTYHYRLVGSNKAGAGYGADQSFTTPPAPPAATSPPPAPGFAGVTLVSTRLALSGRFITLKLSCPAGTVGGCSGQTKLSARRRTGTRRVALGKARFSVAAGGRAKVRMRVSRAGLQRLRGVRRLRARDVTAARDGAGTSKTTVANVTVRRRK